MKSQISQKRIGVPNNPPVRIRPQMKTHRVVPYVSGLSESYSRVMEKNGIKVYFKGHNTIRNILVAPKDPDSKLNKSGVIYRIRCGSCSDSYIGESARLFQDRLKDHRRAPSPVHHHRTTTGHPLLQWMI